ncbi:MULTISPECIES: hypothetical protein [unclassified Moorena]|uniref:hypothetical protein n=1 Tax=unclassified Moorena TaxID=2683338 RepID=UPI0013B6F145|nr:MULTISPECIES: hypothetical protein [unclassified Moorena]NER88162.1 hypothetical protein [Moorena sp. SIO3A2]NES42701.1 hypothetical protein [Moorena sp. SIO2C4]NET65314.1 hypothetical protein [Moorena sp. SIO1G6]
MDSKQKRRYTGFLPVPESRIPIPDSRIPIPDSRFPIPDSLKSRMYLTYCSQANPR